MTDRSPKLYAQQGKQAKPKAKMDALKEMRAKVGPRITSGLPDQYIQQFLASDINLALAINKAKSVFDSLDPKTTYEQPEGKLIEELQEGWYQFFILRQFRSFRSVDTALFL